VALLRGVGAGLRPPVMKWQTGSSLDLLPRSLPSPRRVTGMRLEQFAAGPSEVRRWALGPSPLQSAGSASGRVCAGADHLWLQTSCLQEIISISTFLSGWIQESASEFQYEGREADKVFEIRLCDTTG